MSEDRTAMWLVQGGIYDRVADVYSNVKKEGIYICILNISLLWVLPKKMRLNFFVFEIIKFGLRNYIYMQT